PFYEARRAPNQNLKSAIGEVMNSNLAANAKNPIRRTLMKHTTVTLLTIACFATLLGLALPAQAAQCSLAGVAGDYGYTTTGFVATPTGVFVPAAAAGRISFD